LGSSLYDLYRVELFKKASSVSYASGFASNLQSHPIVSEAALTRFLLHGSFGFFEVDFSQLIMEIRAFFLQIRNDVFKIALTRLGILLRQES
jgi:hypothetical protein